MAQNDWDHVKSYCESETNTDFFSIMNNEMNEKAIDLCTRNNRKDDCWINVKRADCIYNDETDEWNSNLYWITGNGTMFDDNGPEFDPWCDGYPKKLIYWVLDEESRLKKAKGKHFCAGPYVYIDNANQCWKNGPDGTDLSVVDDDKDGRRSKSYHKPGICISNDDNELFMYGANDIIQDVENIGKDDMIIFLVGSLIFVIVLLIIVVIYYGQKMIKKATEPKVVIYSSEKSLTKEQSITLETFNNQHMKPSKRNVNENQ